MNLEGVKISQDERGNKIYSFKDTSEWNLNSKINFKGKNNILFIAKDAKFKDSFVGFSGDDSLVFIGNSLVDKVSIGVFYNQICYIGNKNYFNPGSVKSLALSEGKHIIIGDNCLFSFNIWFRNADPHLIYDVTSKQRINPSKSIIIGDHVWCGQDAGFMKGAFVASGSIIGAKSMVAGKTYYSNSIYGGSPCRKIKENIFWSGQCVHTWTDEMTQKYQEMPTGDFIFSFKKEQFLDPILLDKKLSSLPNAYEKLEFVYQNIYLNTNKNRFACFENLSSAKKSNSLIGAKVIIQNELAYKLGSAMIKNSKSVKGWFVLPFELAKISQKHKKEQELYQMLLSLNVNFTLSKLEDYADFDEALRMKNHLSYKLGEALIEANNKKWGGVLQTAL
ncbi:acyltransferase [Campylobacter sp. US33a]|uniref:acyltransferase n=1 Tax=Campylobacter sp. US33a TaxID=2498120 RepID=UPI0010675A19|nr:acyltransferase [Campylobacter sp. US33a]TEY04071.1 acyltransferase [Campylobacter sp. US33a]